MRCASLHPGDRVEIDRKGFVFTATVREARPGHYVYFEDPDPSYITWKMVKPAYVKRKVAA